MDRTAQKLKYYLNNTIKDPYEQISQNGFTPLGNLKTYGVANLYDRPEPTQLNDLPELYTVPYATTPYLGSVVPSRKYIDIESNNLRYPVMDNKKSVIDVSQIDTYPMDEYEYVSNPNVSKELNIFYKQSKYINEVGAYSEDLNNNLIGLGQSEFSRNSRFVNRWNYIDPRITQNVKNIIMNVTTPDGNEISLPSCGISSRNELRNYVEVNKC